MNTKQLMWKFLIANGKCIEKFNYYGNTTNYTATEELQKLSEEELLTLIDWNKTKDVRDDTMDEFRGTFCDNPPVNILYGDMTTCSGEEFEWVLKLEDTDVTSLILKVLGGYVQ